MRLAPPGGSHTWPSQLCLDPCRCLARTQPFARDNGVFSMSRLLGHRLHGVRRPVGGGAPSSGHGLQPCRRPNVRLVAESEWLRHSGVAPACITSGAYALVKVSETASYHCD